MAGIEWDTSEVRVLAADLGAVSASATPRLAKVVRESADNVQRDARTFAAVLTGAMRADISVQAAGLNALIEADIRYATFQEHGTSKMAAHPFMAPAADANAGRFYQAVAEAAEGLLD